MIYSSGNHFGKRTAWSLLDFLIYVYLFIIYFSLSQIFVIILYLQPISSLGTLVNLFTGQKPRGNEDVVSLSAKTIIWNWIYMYISKSKQRSVIY